MVPGSEVAAQEASFYDLPLADLNDLVEVPFFTTHQDDVECRSTSSSIRSSVSIRPGAKLGQRQECHITICCL